MNQKEATDLGYRLLKDAPLSNGTRGYVESSLPYIIQRYYLAGYLVVPASGGPTKAKFPVFKPGEIEEYQKDGVIY